MRFSDIYRSIEKNGFVLETSIYKKVDGTYYFYKKSLFKLKIENPPIVTYTLKNVAFAKEFIDETVYLNVPEHFDLDKLKTMNIRKHSYEGSKPFNKMFKYLKNDSKFFNFMFKTWDFFPFKIVKDGVQYYIEVNAVHTENYFSNFNNRMTDYKNEIKKNELVVNSLEDQIKSLNEKVNSINQKISKLKRKNNYIKKLFNSNSYEKALNVFC